MDPRTHRARQRHAHINKRILAGVRAAILAIERDESECAKLILIRISAEHYAPDQMAVKKAHNARADQG